MEGSKELIVEIGDSFYILPFLSFGSSADMKKSALQLLVI
jgi:hypothetical protein